MSFSFPKTSLNQVLGDFQCFIKNSSELSSEEKEETLQLLENRTIQSIFHLSFIQIFWSVCVFFIDSFLLSRTTIVLLVGKGFWSAVLPTVFFVVINATIKFFFIRSFARGKIDIPIRYVFLGIIPTIGSFLLAGRLLVEQKTFFLVMKKYLKEVRKKLLSFS